MGIVSTYQVAAGELLLDVGGLRSLAYRVSNVSPDSPVADVDRHSERAQLEARTTPEHMRFGLPAPGGPIRIMRTPSAGLASPERRSSSFSTRFSRADTTSCSFWTSLSMTPIFAVFYEFLERNRIPDRGKREGGKEHEKGKKRVDIKKKRGATT